MNIVICVFACATIEKYKLELMKVIDTWGQHAKERNVKVIYFLGEEQTELKGNEFVYLQGVDNTYESASVKQNLGLKYIDEHENADFVLVCGTDTYVNIDQLLLYLKTSNGDYIGGGGQNPLYFTMDQTYYYHSGAGFILSRKALMLLSPHLETMFESWKQQCCRYYVYYLIPACDACISFYLHHVFKNHIVIKEPTLFYACNYKGMIKNQSCCENVDYKKIIVCHYMTLDDFDDYTALLKENC
jgi:hypothetical protein